MSAKEAALRTVATDAATDELRDGSTSAGPEPAPVEAAVAAVAPDRIWGGAPPASRRQVQQEQVGEERSEVHRLINWGARLRDQGRDAQLKQALKDQVANTKSAAKRAADEHAVALGVEQAALQRAAAESAAALAAAEQRAAQAAAAHLDAAAGAQR